MNSKGSSRREILDALARFQKEDIRSLRVDDIVETLAEESDRGFVVLAGSITEDMLLERLFAHLPGVTPSLRKNMTRSGGVLSTWADRTNMALAMGLIDEDDADILEVLKSMRNACAHSRRHIDFKTPEIKDAIGLMFDGNAPSEIREADNVTLLRVVFFLAVSYIWGRLRGETPEQAHDRVTGLWEEFREDVDRQAALHRKRNGQGPATDGGPPTLQEP